MGTEEMTSAGRSKKEIELFADLARLVGTHGEEAVLHAMVAAIETSRDHLLDIMASHYEGTPAQIRTAERHFTNARNSMAHVCGYLKDVRRAYESAPTLSEALEVLGEC